MKKWINNFNIQFSKIAETKWASSALFFFAFADSFFLPLPVTTFFLILLLLNTNKAVKYVLLVTSGILTGALGGFLLGHFAWLTPDGEFTRVASFLLNNMPGFSVESYTRVHALFSRWDFWIICASAATPLPFTIFTISSGVFDVNIVIFLIATLISQGVKFSLIALFTVKLSPKIKSRFQLNWKPLAIITSASLIVLIVITRVL